MMHLFSKTTNLLSFLVIAGFAIIISSCTIVKNHPKKIPFVFENKINLKDSGLSKEERKRLITELTNYWDDSLKARKMQQFGIVYKLKNPAVFDTVNIGRTVTFMNAYLNSQGYYYATLKPTYQFDTVKTDEIRTTISMNIDIGKNITIQSVTYKLLDTTTFPIDSTIQKLTLEQAKNSYLKPGKPYNKQAINNEIERLNNWFHQNGLFNYRREYIYALIDTLDSKLLTLSLDPFEQAKILADAAKQRRENPKWDITFLQKPITDSSITRQYYVGHIYYYPDIKDAYYIADSILQYTNYHTATFRGSTVKYVKDKFKIRPLREHTYLQNKNLYNEDLYYKSINRLSQIGTWKQVDGKAIIRDKDSIDFHFFMVAEKKQNFTIDLESSRNTGDIGSGNLLGIATNLSYRNRNIGKQAIQSLTSFRLGFEFNIDGSVDGVARKPFLQTTQLSLSNTFSFPRIIGPINKLNFIRKFENKRTLLSTSGAYIDRRGFYQLRSLVLNLGLEGTKGNTTYLLKLPNIELYKVDTLAGLINLFNQNPFLRNSFRNGNVVGLGFSISSNFNSKKDPTKNHYFRAALEESGLFTHLITKNNKSIFKFLKVEGEYRYIKKYPKTEIASRIFVGVGIPIEGQSIPVFKQYFLGGPNSMRAWGLRQLGLGSSIKTDTSTSGYTDRFGDFNLETNFEYRFQIANIAGIKVGSALYADIGNIWNINRDPNDAQAVVSLNNLTKDIAIAMGTGLRFDFSYFLLRVDFAYRVKDPARLGNNGWMSIKNFEWSNMRQNGISVKNYAFQLGIGLPF
ncbi:MAG: BamA/TamA family outer membrane protein [Chitinophagaceae bacterium]